MIQAGFKSGFVALVGRPSVGKSTLLNALLKTTLSIVSPKPQTTRHKLLGILNGDGFQACFLDTPGMLDKPKDLLQKSLGKAARAAAYDDADLVALLISPDCAAPADISAFSMLSRRGIPVLLVLNKADLLEDPARARSLLAPWEEALKPQASLVLSARTKEGVEALRAEILSRLPESPPYFEPGQLSDRWERFFAAEIVREQVFSLYQQEVPHAIAVVVESFQEDPKGDRVHAVLFVERDSQKAIVIGKGGKALEDLRRRAQASLENFLGRPAHLEIWVKVRHDWRKDPRSLKEFGYL